MFGYSLSILLLASSHSSRSSLLLLSFFCCYYYWPNSIIIGNNFWELGCELNSLRLNQFLTPQGKSKIFLSVNLAINLQRYLLTRMQRTRKNGKVVFWLAAIVD